MFDDPVGYLPGEPNSSGESIEQKPMKDAGYNEKPIVSSTSVYFETHGRYAFCPISYQR
jgi:hypothetical protein